MPTAKAPIRQRLSLVVQAPRVRKSIDLVRQTMLPPDPRARWKRMAAAFGVLVGLGFAGYAGTGSAGWAVLLLVVGVPVVVLPVILIVAMVMEERVRRAAP